MNDEKRNFLEKQFMPLIRTIPADTIPRWGKMNTQQMVEHVADFFRVSTEKIKLPLVTPLEKLTAFKDFLLSEKEFRENTKAPVLPEEPLPVRKATIEESLAFLEKEVEAFFTYFKNDEEKKTLHPVFGELNFPEWVQLHHKHVKHHLKQFGKEI